jgi:hypothetical protein
MASYNGLIPGLSGVGSDRRREDVTGYRKPSGLAQCRRVRENQQKRPLLVPQESDSPSYIWQPGVPVAPNSFLSRIPPIPDHTTTSRTFSPVIHGLNWVTSWTPFERQESVEGLRVGDFWWHLCCHNGGVVLL